MAIAEEKIDFDAIFNHPTFNTTSENVNNNGIKSITKQLLNYEKEDNQCKSKNTRKRSYNDMMNTNRNYNNYNNFNNNNYKNNFNNNNFNNFNNNSNNKL